MARNIEIKARIDDIDNFKTKIESITDCKPTDIIQDDTFFNCNGGRLKLRILSDDNGELIFYKRPDVSGPKESFYLISKTFEPNKLRQVLVQAYGTAGRIQKRRMLYYKGRTRIHLDSVKGLGNFIELEVAIEENESQEDGIKEAKAILSQLEIKDVQLVECAYVDLLKQNKI